jgi:hypothetical protein
MQFLADESCDALIVRKVRTAGHSVAYIAEVVAAHAIELPGAMTTLTLKDIRIRGLSETATDFEESGNSIE